MINAITFELMQKFLITNEINLTPTNKQIKREMTNLIKAINQNKTTIKHKFMIYFIKQETKTVQVKQETKTVPIKQETKTVPIKQETKTVPIKKETKTVPPNKVWITDEMEIDLINIKKKQKEINNIFNKNKNINKKKIDFDPKTFDAKIYIDNFIKRKHQIKFKYITQEILKNNKNLKKIIL